MQRIGVFVCWCGSNIAATVDVKKVAETLGKEPGVVFPPTTNICALRQVRTSLRIPLRNTVLRAS